MAAQAVDYTGALVLVPTYNEAENLSMILDRVFAAAPTTQVLIIDDDSPDGTGELALQIAAENPQVHVLNRSGRYGLGTAYLEGFQWGIERGFDLLIEMDADGSHPPEVLGEMVSLMRKDPELGLVIGSRWVDGGAVVDWPLRRLLLSRGANLFARVALGVKVRDITAGYRVFRADCLAALDLTDVSSKGYCFQIDMTLRVLDAGASVVEYPIVFRDRVAGESKMSGDIIVEAMRSVVVWGAQRRFTQLRKSLTG